MTRPKWIQLLKLFFKLSGFIQCFHFIGTYVPSNNHIRVKISCRLGLGLSTWRMSYQISGFRKHQMEAKRKHLFILTTIGWRQQLKSPFHSQWLPSCWRRLTLDWLAGRKVSQIQPPINQIDTIKTFSCSIIIAAGLYPVNQIPSSYKVVCHYQTKLEEL